MKKKENLFGKTVAIYGLSKTGLAAANALKKRGVYVIAWDDNEESQILATQNDITLKNLHDYNFSNIDYLIWSPGIPHTLPKPNPIAMKAKQAGVEIISDIEVFINLFPDYKYIGITGTNGKSTVTGLIHHILNCSGKHSAVGANYGIPVFELPILPDDGIYVFELSSYQIELTPSLNMSCSVLTNISPDHLDRHKDMNGYANVKSRIFNRTDIKQHYNVICIDDEYSKKIFKKVSGNVKNITIPVSTKRKIEGIYVTSDGILKDNFFEKDINVLDLKTVTNLLGKHNWQNIANCYAVSRCYKIAIGKFIKAVSSFINLQHRMETVQIPEYFGNILVVNDSKGTNADATQYALEAYNEIYWIAGGRPKTDGIDPLMSLINDTKIIRGYMIGEATSAFHKLVKNKINSYRCWNMKCAVNKAFKHILKDLKKGVVTHPTLLLSPSATSWDQYKSFEDRGDDFKKLILQIADKYSNKYIKK